MGAEEVRAVVAVASAAVVAEEEVEEAHEEAQLHMEEGGALQEL